MNRLYKYFFTAIILLSILTGILQAQNYPIITKVQSFDGFIRVSLDWGGGSGKNIYKVFRSIGGSNSMYVGDVVEGSAYFDDNKDLYKTTDQFFSYQVVGPQGQSNIMGVSYNSTSSAAKRTWGSIKAMFR
jgi:hypothetical protein